MWVTVNGKSYTFEEAEKLGLLKALDDRKSPSINFDNQNQFELSIDHETKSLSISMNESEPIDIPKDIMIDVTGFKTFKAWVNYIEDEGLEEDEDFLSLIAEKMNLINNE